MDPEHGISPIGRIDTRGRTGRGVNHVTTPPSFTGTAALGCGAECEEMLGTARIGPPSRIAIGDGSGPVSGGEGS
jgi:hypothetical protein